MGTKSMLFDKPVGILARSNEAYSPDVEIHIKFAQNGFKIRNGNKAFVAKTIKEAINIVRTEMEGLQEDLKEKEKPKKDEK